MQTYVYKLKLNTTYYEDTNWTDDVNQIIESHYNRLKADFNMGLLKHVGRTSDPKGEGFGLVIFDSTSFEDALNYMNDDPAVKAGIMTAELFEYKWIF